MASQLNIYKKYVDILAPVLLGVYGSIGNKLFMYADDILAVITDPVDSLPVLLECINAYAKLPCYKINWHKSEAMPLSNTCHSSYVT